MKNNTKIAIAAAATLLAGVAVASLPAAAQDNGPSSTPSSSQKADHALATVSATITGIPATVTSSHEASHGAYFTVYQLSSSATLVPATQPTEGGKRLGVRPERGAAEPAIKGSTLTSTVGFHADVVGTSKYALYPSDGSAAILVTVSVSDTGNATVSSSRPITVAYSAAVAAEHPVRNHDETGHGKRDGDKRDGGKGHRGKGHGPRH